MINLDKLRCCSYEDFSDKLEEIDSLLAKAKPEKETLDKIASFIENNHEVFICEQRIAIRLDSIGAKVRRIAVDEPLITKLQGLINQLLPSNQQEAKVSMQFFRSAIQNPSDCIAAIADWMELMRIPLAHLELSVEELVALVPRLEYLDLTKYDFQSIDLAKFVNGLLNPKLKFKTTNTISLTAIAKLCVKQDPWNTSHYIKRFAIQDDGARIEIAKECLQLSGRATAEHINNFGIQDERARIEIAKQCAKKNGMAVAECIMEFRVVDERNRIEIAKLCAQQSGNGTAEHIRNFGITDEAARLEILKLCVEQSRGSIAEHFKKFGIRSEKARIEIAMLCAKQNGRSVAKYFRDFAIQDEGVRIEIAKQCAENNGWGTAKYFRNFAIWNQDAKIEIAKLCTRQYALFVAEYFHHFGIGESEAKIEIAKLCAQQSGWGTSKHIQNFKINEEFNRIEIAKMCAEQNGGGGAEFIRNFEIKNHVARSEIAILCIEQDPFGAALSIKRFNIKDKKTLYQLFIRCARADPKTLFLMDNFSPLPAELEELPLCIDVLDCDHLGDKRREKLFAAGRGLILNLTIPQEHRNTILAMIDEVQKLPIPAHNSAGLWLLNSILSMREMKQDALEKMLGSGIWTELGLLQDPSLRNLLSRSLYQLLTKESQIILWKDFIDSVRGIQGQRGLMLLIIPFFELQIRGIDQRKLYQVAQHLSRLREQKKSHLRSAHHIKTFLHTLHVLANHKGYSQQQIMSGFQKIFFSVTDEAPENLRDEEQILKNVISVKGLLQLKDPYWPTTTTTDLDLQFRASLDKVIPTADFIGDIAEKYEEVFGKCRKPCGLLTYAAGLKTLREPDLLTCLGKYVVSVLDGSFKCKRYETANNPHLAKLSEWNPDLMQSWWENIEVEERKITPSLEQNHERFNPEQWLATKVVVDKHLGAEKLTYLTEYLTASNPQERDHIFASLLRSIREIVKPAEKQLLRTEILNAKKRIKDVEKQLIENAENEHIRKQLGSQKKEIEESLSHQKLQLTALKERNPVLTNLNLQRACLRLAQAGKEAENKTLLLLLEEIDHILHQETASQIKYSDSEFAKDVKALLETFKRQSDDSVGDLLVVFTDDPIDLLLCGTDVSGSCQRLDGSPDFNKGLLGYLMDGKNKMLAIKNGAKIASRCILRLLWDGEQPVVYRERFYPDHNTTHHKYALNYMAKQVAQKLSLPLTCGDEGVPYSKDLIAIGGPAPYEYSDGSQGVYKDGRYTIKNAKRMVI